MNWITKQIQEAMSDIILSFVEFFQKMVVEIFDNGTNFATNQQISGAVDATTLIGIALVSVMVLKQILSVYVFETDGDAETDPLQLIVKASQTICIICCNDLIYTELQKVSKLTANDLNNAVTPDKVFASLQAVITQGAGLVILGPVNLIFIIIYLIGFILLVIKAAIRGVELAVMKILVPIFAVDNITVSGERWNAFLSSYIVVFFGYIIQMLCFNMSIISFVKAITDSGVEYLYAVGFLIFSLKSPQWLEKFAYNSGLSRGIKGAASTGMQMAYMMRFARFAK